MVHVSVHRWLVPRHDGMGEGPGRESLVERAALTMGDRKQRENRGAGRGDTTFWVTPRVKHLFQLLPPIWKSEISQGNLESLLLLDPASQLGPLTLLQ